MWFVQFDDPDPGLVSLSRESMQQWYLCSIDLCRMEFVRFITHESNEEKLDSRREVIDYYNR